ncbi:Heterokaryon incompatibility protein (HET) domain containing protein [Hyaloscypha variabilis]
MEEVSSASNSIYEPLPSPTHIRLLRRLSRGEAAASSPPRVYLETHDLQKSPDFTALSYTWGSCVDDSDSSHHSSEVFRIECNGQLHTVTENLFHFLDSCGQDFLWVDALCINQENLDERAQQVSLMGQIYASANIVIMWLGKDTSDLEEFVFLHEKFLPELDKRLRDIDFSTQSIWDLQFLGEIGIQSKARWRQYWTAYHRFYQRRRFFYRAWIVQEFALSRKQVFACGPSFSLLHVNLMNRLSTYLYMGMWHEELQYLDLSNSKAENPMGIMLSAREYLFTERIDSREFQVTEGGPEGTFQKRAYESMFGAITPEARWFCFLLRLIQLVRQLEATDSRDKIYSIVGLANLHLPEGLPQPIIPSYRLTMRETYISVTAQIICSIPYFGVLSLVHGGSEQRTNTLPSWVPDYFRPPTCEPLDSLGSERLISLSTNQVVELHHGSGVLYNASRVTPSESAFREIQEDKLVVKGARFARIEEVSTSFDFVFLPLGLFPILKVCRNIGTIYEATGQNRIEALWRTLIADYYDDQYPAPDLTESFRDYVMWIICHYLIFDTSDPKVVSETVKQIHILDELQDNETPPVLFGSSEVFQRYLTLQIELRHEMGRGLGRRETFPLIPRGSADQFDHVVGRRMTGRCIYRTTEGYLGAGPTSMREGDEVWLVEGALVPFIMRPAGDTDERALTLVGETYIHGFMHGEMLTEELRVRTGRICIV